MGNTKAGQLLLLTCLTGGKLLGETVILSLSQALLLSTCLLPLTLMRSTNTTFLRILVEFFAQKDKSQLPTQREKREVNSS